MKLEFLPQDYCMKFTGTLVNTVRDGEIQPALVNGSPRAFILTCREIRKDGTQGAAYEVDVRTDEFNPRPPKFGMISYRGSLCFVSRKPLRHHKQGIRSGSLIYRHYVRSMDTPPNIYEVMNPTYTPLAEALREAQAVHTAGYAVTRFLGVISSPEEGHAHIVYRSNKVGDFKNGELVLYPSMEILLDTLQRAGFERIRLGNLEEENA